MKVNDVLRKGEVLIRILNTKDDLCLCINCNTESMPAWMPANLLEDYTPEAAPVIDTNMTARQKQVAHERFTMIAPMLAFLTDDKERYRIMNKSPVKSLIIGKNDLSKKVKHSHSFIGKSFKGKVSFKVNKGWKLYRMYKFKTSQLLTGGGVKQVSLKKNKSFKLNKGERLIVQFQKGSTIQSIRYDAK